MKYFICNIYTKLKKKLSRVGIILYFHGLTAFINRIFFNKSLNKLDYLYWIKYCEKKQDLVQINKQIRSFARKPIVGIIVLIYHPNLDYLKQTIESVTNQYYNRWILYLIINGHHDKKYEMFLKQKENESKKIKCYFLNNNLGISEAANFAVSKCETEYIGFLDHDDLLNPELLFEYVKIINNNQNVDLIYCDEDKINSINIREQPMFKSAWGPDSLKTYMFINHFLLIKKDIFLKAGCFNKNFDGTQDYELLLRISKLTKDIFHVPYILYHWRMSSSSTAVDINNKPYAYNRYIRSKYKFLQHYNIKLIPKPKQYATEIKYIFSERSSHVIFTCTNIQYLDSITHMLNIIKKSCICVTYNILIPKKYEKAQIINNIKHKFEDSSKIYFYSKCDIYKIYNEIIKIHSKEIFIFIENGIYLHHGDIIDIINHSLLKDVGAVTGLILNNRLDIKSAGINFLNRTRKFRSMFQGEQISNCFVIDKATLTENILSVNSCFMCITKEKLNLVKGFNHIYQSNKYIILDLNLRLLLHGMFNVKRGDILFISKVSVDKYSICYKNSLKEDKDLSILLSIYEDVILNKFMYYNKNLCNKYPNYSLDLFNRQY